MSRIAIFLSCLLAALLTAPAHSAAPWNTQDYDIFPGDFNGDGKTDFLVIAKNSANASGIYLSDGSGPNVVSQIWPSNYLGINWQTSQYNVIVADFNGDRKSDILLQSISTGNCYLLLTNSAGQVSGISQTIPAAGAMGLVWTGDQHRIVAGDFNHDGKADLFLQATTSSGINAVVLVSSTGQFTASTPAQTWSDGYLGFQWAASEAFVYAADFDGDGYADLLIQRRPNWVEISYTPSFPVPTFPPNANGVVYAQAGTTIFAATRMQAWSEVSNGVNWSPLVTNILAGNFNGTGGADLLLQALNSSGSSYLLTSNATGAAFGSGTALASNATWSADSYRLLTANFSGSAATGVYFLPPTSGGTSYYAGSVTGSSVTLTAQSPPLTNEVIAYAYDALGRLTTVSYSGAVNNSVQASYSYDSAGNRLSVAVAPH